MALVLEEERRTREGREELDQSRRGLNTEVLDVWRNVRDRDRERREERVEARRCCDRVNRLESRKPQDDQVSLQALGKNKHADGWREGRLTAIRKSAAVPGTTYLAGRGRVTVEDDSATPNA